jgi:hypothetical protein
MADEHHKPMTSQFLLERLADGLKVLGAGNGAGLLAAGTALQLFSSRTEVLLTLKLVAGAFLLGVLTFAGAFFSLVALIWSIEEFQAAEPNRAYQGFDNLIKELVKPMRRRRNTMR